MLKFIYGRAATGKSYRIIKDISADVESGRDVVLLVPEQFTFESERALLKALGNKATTDVSVLSFTRMYDEITRKVGGRVANNITDSDRIILMNRAFKAVKDRLCIWEKYVNSPRFTANLINAVTEFKTSAISPEEILSTANTVESKYLKAKLQDISTVYSAYNALLGNTFLDPIDDLTRLSDKLLTYRYFEGKNVYIDSFKNFTGQQYKILERVISQADNVYISVTSDALDSAELSIFSNVNNTVRKICDIAKKYSIKVADSENMHANHYKAAGLSSLEAFLSGCADKINSTDGLEIVKCETVAAEAELAARTIRRLVREEGYRFRDFVIISRNAEQYQKYIEKHCADNEVFCFTDKRCKISNLPLPVLISKALSLTVSLTTDDILSFHKTSLTNITLDELSALENYTYLWNVKGADWQQEWTMNPNGFVADTYGEAGDYSDTLNHLNALRHKAILPIINLRRDFHGTPKDLCAAIIKLINECNTAERLKERLDECNKNDLKEQADDLRQSWDAVMDLLDGLVKCLPNSEINSAEFIDLWETSLNFATIGNIPQMVDEVTFGSADRIKPSRPKVAFVLGVNQGIFPAKAPTSGIFAVSEREAIIKSGLEIPDYGISSVIDEEYLLYTSLCCPTERLYITFSVADNSGAALEPAQVIGEIVEKSQDLKIIENNSSALSTDNLPETTKTAVKYMFSNYKSDKNAYLTLKTALGDKAENSVDAKIKCFSKEKAKISPDNAVQLFGNKIGISATGFDTFHRCKFSYFCRYGLGLKKLQPAEFDVLQRGTLSHYVLENFVKRYIKEFSDFSRADSDTAVEELVAEYLSLIDGYEKIATPRTEFLVNIITASLKDVANHIVCEMSQCDFRPEFFELKIGNQGVIPTLSVPFSQNGEMRIRGSIDRVDIYGNYVRIVDYKTGTKVFKLPDILVGLNLQMLIYLYTVIRGDNEYLSSKLPAGILYMPSKREFGDPKVLSMNGLILLDEEVISAMDKEGEGEYIPKKPFKADGTLKSRVTSYAEPAVFEQTFNYIELLLKRMGNDLHSGNFNADPVDGVDLDACKYCDFSAVCCFENKEHRCAERDLSQAEVLEKLREANASGI